MRFTKLLLSAILLFCVVSSVVLAQTVKDIDGNIYKTVTIGTQIWMAENLKTTKYNNGDLIYTTTPQGLDLRTESEPKYQWVYDGNENNVDTYGRLYTWYAVTDSRNLCPTGCHVPTDAEWATLANFLGGSRVAGYKLKEKRYSHWLRPNEGATNETGFTALPSGIRFSNGQFSRLGYYGYWWSSTEYSSTNAYFRVMDFDTSDVFQNNFNKHYGQCIRCIKDN